MTEEMKVVMRSRYQMFAAQEKLIKTTSADGNITYYPTVPIHVYKHTSQFRYNIGKWGLDKNTE